MLRRITLMQGRARTFWDSSLAQSSRIMKDFYLAEADASKRPKIFGMTASPVDAREDVVKAAKSVSRDLLL